MILTGAMHAALLIDFFRRLFQDPQRKVFLILDNLKVHHAHVVTAWLDPHWEQIEVFYLPPYSPELNQDELLNAESLGGCHEAGANTRQGKNEKGGDLPYAQDHQVTGARDEIL